jgi:protein-S-isoprenylcysteine O-methyltransferase Ste14
MVPRATAASPEVLIAQSAAACVASDAVKGGRLTPAQLVIEIGLRVGTVLMLALFSVSVVHQYLRDTSRITLLVFLCAEVLTTCLAVCSRVPRERDWNPLSVVMAVGAGFYFVAFRIEPGVRLIPETLAMGLQGAGVLVSIWAKCSLRRSFGILPANRGVVGGGPYRIIRHPIYFGYFVRDCGFLLANFGLQNLLVVVGHCSLQIGRIVREERLLSKDQTYRQYMQRVRYRLIAGLY